MSQKLKELMEAIVADKKVDANEVGSLRALLYADGAIDRKELTVLMQINDATANGANCLEWQAFFVQAGTDALLADTMSANVVDTEEADLLIGLIGADAQVSRLEILLLVNICATASSVDEKLTSFTLDAIKTAILADGKVDTEEAQMLRTVIYGQGGAGGTKVSKEELAVLFAINDATSGNNNSREWTELFVQAGTDAYLEDGVLDANEAADLINLIGADGKVTELEKALVANIMAKATSADPALQAFAAGL